jgi:4-hydroxy-2-oxoheptanedioate aldolase
MINRLAKEFRDKVLSGECVIGTFLNMGSSVSAEIAALSGWDWVVIDLEHGAVGEAGLLPQLHGLASGGVTAPIVRIEVGARLRVGRALDLGAAGIMAPRVDSEAEAQALVSWARYPPAGERGVALMARAGRYGRLSHAEVPAVNEEVLTIVQVETRSAVDDVKGIASVPGVDVLFVGPSDLSHSLGVPGAFGDSRFTEHLDRVVEAAAAAGKVLGVLVRRVEDTKQYFDRGFRFIGIGSDSATLFDGSSSTIDAARSVLSGK